MNKLWGLKVGGVQTEEKKMCVLKVRKLIFLLVIFSLLLFLCTSKMISKAWDSANITF
jgi:hypothetical protein